MRSRFDKDQRRAIAEAYAEGEFVESIRARFGGIAWQTVLKFAAEFGVPKRGGQRKGAKRPKGVHKPQGVVLPKDEPGVASFYENDLRQELQRANHKFGETLRERLGPEKMWKAYQ